MRLADAAGRVVPGRLVDEALPVAHGERGVGHGQPVRGARLLPVVRPRVVDDAEVGVGPLLAQAPPEGLGQVGAVEVTEAGERLHVGVQPLDPGCVQHLLGHAQLGLDVGALRHEPGDDGDPLLLVHAHHAGEGFRPGDGVEPRVVDRHPVGAVVRLQVHGADVQAAVVGAGAGVVGAERPDHGHEFEAFGRGRPRREERPVDELPGGSGEKEQR